MRNAATFLNKIRRGEPCTGMAITTSDPVVVEGLCTLLDGIWIDGEHAPLTLPDIQALVIAAQTTPCAAIVRVPANDPALIKPILDLGADGIIVPMVCTADEARRAVAACRYPPLGIRGLGPRRAFQFGRYGSLKTFIQRANEEIIVFTQIEHADALPNLDDILAVEGLTGIIIGPNDLALSMGLAGETGHPDVRRAIDHIIDAAQGTGKIVGIATGGDVEMAARLVEQGVRWMVMETEGSLLQRAAGDLFGAFRQRIMQHPAQPIDNRGTV